MVKDPVCGMQIDEKTAAGSSEYKGETYYFCAPVCKARFDAESRQLRQQGPLKDDSGRELPLGIERPFHRAHFVNPLIPIQLAEQHLLHRTASDPMLGER